MCNILKSLLVVTGPNATLKGEERASGMPRSPLSGLVAREEKTLPKTETPEELAGREWCERHGQALDRKKRRPAGGGGAR